MRLVSSFKSLSWLDPAFLSASLTADLIPFDEYVAPEIESTLRDCLDIIDDIRVLALSKYGASSTFSSIFILEILPPLTTTSALTLPLNPVPLP